MSLIGPVAAIFNLPPGKSGLLVQQVAKGSLGDKLGLVPGSITATIDGQKLLLGGDIVLEVMGLEAGLAAAQFRERLDLLKPDDSLEVIVLRAGKQLKLFARWEWLQP